jgi:hypothetical protein
MKKELEPLQEKALRGLVLRLRNPEQKVAAQGALRALGRQALAPLIGVIQRSPAAEAAVFVEAANVVSGTAFSPSIVDDRVKLEEAIRSWNAGPKTP